jgi:hypothetical protein
MFWLTRPPYWRWFAAAAVIAGAAYVDLTDPPGESYPFVAEPADMGESVAIEWRQVPRGVLPPHADVSGVARQHLEAGTPLAAGLLESASAVPGDWWAVSVELPITATAGGDVMITTRAPDLQVVGIVVAPSTSSGFGSVTPGLVAFPPDRAATIANAITEHRATILVRP